MKEKKRKVADGNDVQVREIDGFTSTMSDSQIYAKATIKLSLQHSETFKRLVSTKMPMENSDIIDVLRSIGQDVSNGKMAHLEQTLVSQTVLLDSLFNNLVNKAYGSQYQRNFENVLKLAFKAQAQARCTVEALALLKNPQPYIRQANIAQGHQQVNNTYAQMPTDTDNAADVRGEEIKRSQIKVLEGRDGNGLDIGETATAGRTDQELEAVA